MRITFTNFALAACVCFIAAATSISAQTPANQTVKRNSPFSPNPKRKVEKAPKEAVSAPDKTNEKNVKIQNAGLTVNNAEETQTAPNDGSADFESRSAANKTLEIAKRNQVGSGITPKKPTEIYKVGAGDVLDIRILNSPSAKESTLFTVLESGMIDYPLAGQEPVLVSGFTTDEIEEILKEKVKLYENPEITVNVRDYSSHTISVLGLVERPGTKALRREAIPLYVILAEAIPHPEATQATILRGADKQTITVSLEDNETLIYPNDIVRVGSGKIAGKGEPRFYFIGGQINSGGQKDFHDGLTLTQAIMASGGLKKNSARKVVIRRRDADGKLVPTEYDLKFIKEGKVADPVLQAGDTIEIGN